MYNIKFLFLSQGRVDLKMREWRCKWRLSISRFPTTIFEKPTSIYISVPARSEAAVYDHKQIIHFHIHKQKQECSNIPSDEIRPPILIPSLPFNCDMVHDFLPALAAVIPVTLDSTGSPSNEEVNSIIRSQRSIPTGFGKASPRSTNNSLPRLHGNPPDEASLPESSVLG